MADSQEKTHEQIQHESNKVLRERLGHAFHVMSYKQYYPEEFAEVQKTLDFIKEVCLQLQEKIEKVEPPQKQEESPKGPYVMDVPMKAEATQ